MTSKKKGTPSTESAAFRAALQMYVHGPQTSESILLLVDFGNTPGRQSAGLIRAMQTGWLIEIGGRVHISDYARHYFDGTEPEPQVPKPPTGDVATPRVNVNAGLPLSAKYRLNVRGLRVDAMDNSHSAMPSHYAKGQP